MTHTTTHLHFIQFTVKQLEQTRDAMCKLLILGCSLKSLEPYTEHVDYLETLIKREWKHFVTSVQSDDVRMTLVEQVRWYPVYGVEYQKLVKDAEFKKRWSSYDDSI